MKAYSKLTSGDRSVTLTLMAIYPTGEAKRLLRQLDWQHEPDWARHYQNDFREVIHNFSRDLVERGKIQEGESDWSTMIKAGVYFASIKDQIKIQNMLWRKCVRPIHYYRFHKHISDQKDETFIWQKQLDLLEKKELIRLLSKNPLTSTLP
jgi:hypothetical protein